VWWRQAGTGAERGWPLCRQQPHPLGNGVLGLAGFAAFWCGTSSDSHQDRRYDAALMRIVLAVLLCTLVTLGCVWLSGNRAPVYNVVDAPLDSSGSLERVGEQIRLAARLIDWQVEEFRPNVVLATKRHGSHVATAAISYDADSFSIELRGSSQMKQGDGRVHKLYNEWVHDLEAAIRREVSAGK
jgi:hypothetical protein